MHLPTPMWLFLAFAIATAAAYSHPVKDQYSLSDDSTVNDLYDVIHAHIDASRITYPRQKRASSELVQAWVRLLKTTLGSYSGHGNTGGQGRIYVKVGTLDDATQDFYSLGPRNVKKNPFGLNGYIGNRLVVLSTTPPRLVVYNDIRIPKLSIRIIEYHKTFAEAKALMNPEAWYPMQ